MNFDELQKKWNEEPVEGITVPKEVAAFKAAQTPIDKVRKRMRKDFYIQIVMIGIIGLAPFIFDFSRLLTLSFIPFYGMTVSFTAYYFYKFFTFYKESYDLTFDSRKNLLWFYYELKLNIELYKAFSYILFFMGLSFGLLVQKILKTEKSSTPFLESMKDLGTTNLIIGIVIVMVFAFFIAEFSPRLTYGRELKKVKKVLEELDED